MLIQIRGKKDFFELDYFFISFLILQLMPYSMRRLHESQYRDRGLGGFLLIMFLEVIYVDLQREIFRAIHYAISIRRVIDLGVKVRSTRI